MSLASPRRPATITVPVRRAAQAAAEAAGASHNDVDTITNVVAGLDLYFFVNWARGAHRDATRPPAYCERAPSGYNL